MCAGNILHINSMEQSPSWEANSCSDDQEIAPFLCYLKVHDPVHKNPPIGPVLTHMNPVHNSPPYFPKIQSNIVFESTLYAQ